MTLDFLSVYLRLVTVAFVWALPMGMFDVFDPSLSQ